MSVQQEDRFSVLLADYIVGTTDRDDIYDDDTTDHVEDTNL